MSFSGHERNALFISDHGRGFVDVSALSGADLSLDGRTFTRADLDHDGDEDLIIVSRNAPILRIIRNDLAGADAIRVRFREDAVGTRVDVRCGTRVLRRGIVGGTGFATQNSQTLTIGLGACPVVDNVIISKGTTRSNLGRLAPNYTYVVSDGRVVEQTSLRRRSRAVPSTATIPSRFPQSLSNRLRDPDAPMTYVALSASWCRACQDAAPQLQRLTQAAGIVVREVYFEDADRDRGAAVGPGDRRALRDALPAAFGGRMPPLPSGLFIDASGHVTPFVGVPTRSDVPAAVAAQPQTKLFIWLFGFSGAALGLVGAWRFQSARRMRPGAGGETGELLRK